MTDMTPTLTINTEAHVAYLPLSDREVTHSVVAGYRFSCLVDLHDDEIVGVEFLLPLSVNLDDIEKVHPLDDHTRNEILVALFLLSQKMMDHITA